MSNLILYLFVPCAGKRWHPQEPTANLFQRVAVSSHAGPWHARPVPDGRAVPARSTDSGNWQPGHHSSPKGRQSGRVSAAAVPGNLSSVIIPFPFFKSSSTAPCPQMSMNCRMRQSNTPWSVLMMVLSARAPYVWFCEVTTDTLFWKFCTSSSFEWFCPSRTCSKAASSRLSRWSVFRAALWSSKMAECLTKSFCLSR